MLKACWDCLAGDQQRQSDDRYSVHMNGGSSASQWQASNAQNGTMFLVPTRLTKNNAIIVKGKMIDGMLDIGLRPDGSQHNMVCQLHVVYPENGQPDDQIQIRNILNGNYNTFSAENKATDFFPDTTFDVQFAILDQAIRLSVAGSYLDTVQIQHNTDDIRYISVRGEVTELSFVFNMTD